MTDLKSHRCSYDKLLFDVFTINVKYCCEWLMNEFTVILSLSQNLRSKMKDSIEESRPV